MEAGCGDEGCNQANKVIVHIARVAQGGRACGHDCGHLCMKVQLDTELCINYNLVREVS